MSGRLRELALHPREFLYAATFDTSRSTHAVMASSNIDRSLSLSFAEYN